MKPSDVIRRAQRVLIERGWLKGKFGGGGGPCCITEAFREVLPRSEDPAVSDLRRKARSAVAAANGITFYPFGDDLVTFNDADETTLADVLQAFDAGIAYAKAQEGGR